MNEENFKQLCDKALLLINGVSEEVFLYEDEKAFVGAWGDCDVAYDDNTVGGVCGQPSGGGQLRPNSHIKKGAKIGDFVEIKNSTIGEYTAVAHLTYIGDSDVGSNVNFGCGVVTVNYNGDKKFRTVIEDNAFIGCNTNLVAPVRVGKGAYTAAGSTITTDIPDNALAIERGRETIKEGYAEKKLKARTEKFEAIHGKSEEK